MPSNERLPARQPDTYRRESNPTAAIGVVVGALTICGMIIGAIVGIGKIGQALGAHEQHDTDMELRLGKVEQFEPRISQVEHALAETAPNVAWKYRVRGSVAAPTVTPYTAADQSAPIAPKER
jgi:hypothetical protein